MKKSGAVQSFVRSLTRGRGETGGGFWKIVHVIVVR